MNEISSAAEASRGHDVKLGPVTDPLEPSGLDRAKSTSSSCPEHACTTPRLRVSNRLYRNNRDGTFTDVTKRAGLTRADWASSVAVGDYDNDGHEDLFITNWTGTFFTATPARAAWKRSPRPRAWVAGATAGARGPL